MKNNSLSVRIISVSAALAAISAVVQLVHLGYQSPQWGMWIDVVAVTWIIAYFLFGFRSAFLVSLVGAFVITLFDPTTWLGASMKWIATIPMILSLVLYQRFFMKNSRHFDKFRFLFIPVIISLLIRCMIVIPLNYYYAIPIWTGMSTSQAMQVIPWYIIAIFNIVQGILDIFLAWILVYRFKLSRYAHS